MSRKASTTMAKKNTRKSTRTSKKTTSKTMENSLAESEVFSNEITEEETGVNNTVNLNEPQGLTRMEATSPYSKATREQYLTKRLEKEINTRIAYMQRAINLEAEIVKLKQEVAQARIELIKTNVKDLREEIQLHLEASLLTPDTHVIKNPSGEGYIKMKSQELERIKPE